MGNFYWKEWDYIEVQEWLKLDHSQSLFYFVPQEKIITVKLAWLLVKARVLNKSGIMDNGKYILAVASK